MPSEVQLRDLLAHTRRYLADRFGRPDPDRGANAVGAGEVMWDIAKLKRVGYSIAIVLAVAWFGTGVLRWLISPRIQEVDTDTLAYITVVQATETGRFDQLVRSSRDVVQSVTDPELRKLIDLMARVGELSIDQGIQTFEEADSWSGAFKGFFYGMERPLAAIANLGLLLDTADMVPLTNRVDARYQSVIEAHIENEARRSRWKTISWWLFMILAVAGVGCVIHCAGEETAGDSSVEDRQRG